MLTSTMLRGTVIEVGQERFDTVDLRFQHMAGHVGRQALMVGPRALGIFLAIMFAPLRMLLVPMLGGFGRDNRNRPEDVRVPVTPFLLEDETGGLHECYVRGELRGGFLRMGDSVEVTGRRDRRSNVVNVRTVRNDRTGAVTHGHVRRDARQPNLALVARIVLVLLVLIVLLQIIGGGR